MKNIFFLCVLSVLLMISCNNNDDAVDFNGKINETIEESIAENIKPLIDESVKSSLQDLKTELTSLIKNDLKDLSECLKSEELKTLIKSEIEKVFTENIEKLEKSLIQAFEEKIAESTKQLREQIEKLSSSKDLSVKANVSKELKITVADENWGSVLTVDIQKVLFSAASELWKFFPEREISAIYVIHSNDVPMAWYSKNERNEIVVQLTSKDTYYCQYAYQFAHEFCHILCNYADDKAPENKWFEESVCECASIFAIKAMSESWKTNPPYPNWKSYAESLKSYYDACMQDVERKLPENITLKKWYKGNEENLRKNSCQRDLNKKVAQMLFEKLDKEPKNWEAIKYLNQGEKDKENSFLNYLQRWYDLADNQFHSFILEIAEEFGIKLKT